MENFSLILAIVVVTALAFDFTNGFHDTANAMATTISTGALKPKVAVAMSATLNLVGAFLSVEVANTISKGLVDESGIRPEVIFAALVGAILWNLVTWLVGLPSSSSHALMGGLIGATIASAGTGAVHGDVLVTKVLLPALAAPVVAGVAALLATRFSYALSKNAGGKAADKGFRVGQIASAGLVSLAHGTNDAQKTMGIITLALIVYGLDRPRLGPAHLGHPLRGPRHRDGHVHRRLAHHPHDGQGPDRPPAAAGLRRPDQRRRGHPGLLAHRLLPLHHARRLRFGDGRGPRPQGRGRPLVDRDPDVRRLGPHAALPPRWSARSPSP